MQSNIFQAANLENEGADRMALQSNYMLRVAVTPDRPVLALKGSMVAYQGNVEFEHKSAGSVGKMLKRMVTNEDTPLMTVAGTGDVFFADNAKTVELVELQGDALSVNGTNILAFDANLEYDVRRVQGLGMLTGGAFNTVINGHGRVALTFEGKPVVLDCSQQPTFVDVQAAVCWSANLTPTIKSSVNLRSQLRGGTGEAFQYAFHGPGFVVVQPSEGGNGVPPHTHNNNGGGGGLLGELLR